MDGKSSKELEIYFAMARGYQKEGFDVVACDDHKWFDTNYHYIIVPEFTKNQQFYRFRINLFKSLRRQNAWYHYKTSLIGPVSYLL